MNSPALKVIDGWQAQVVRGPGYSPHCDRCPFAVNGKPQKPVRGIGPKKPRWTVIGMEPGQVELVRGEPFVGPSGELFNKILAQLGVDRPTLWITNLALCATRTATDAQKQQAYDACRPRLLQELRENAPNTPVLTLGAAPAQAFLGDEFSITQLAGSLHDVDADGSGKLRPLIPAFHPALLLRSEETSGPDLYWRLLYDAGKAERLARGDAVRFTDDLDVEVVDPARAERLVEAVCAQAEKDKSITIDFETKVKPEVEARYEILRAQDRCFADAHPSALRPHEAQITAVGIGSAAYAISVRWEILTAKAKARIRGIFASKAILKIGHNLRLYDRPVARRHNLPILGNTEDTLHLHHASFPGAPHDLQTVLFQFWCAKPWKSDHRQNSASEIAKAAEKTCGDLRIEIVRVEGALASPPRAASPSAARQATMARKKRIASLHVALTLGALGAAIQAALELYIYNARDVLASARLVKPLRAAVKGTKTEAVVERDVILADIAERTYEVGVPLDFEKNYAFEEKYRGEIAEAEGKLSGALDDPAFRELFFKRMAMEQAKQARKDDPPDYQARVQARHRELTVCGRCHGALGVMRRVAEGTSTVYECAVCGWTGTEKTLAQKLDKRLAHAAKLKRTHVSANALLICPACWVEDKTWTRNKISPVRARTCPRCFDTGIEPFEFNLSADVQLVAYLKAKGVPMYVQTEKGRTSTKKDVLEGMAHVPAVHAIMDYREAKKMLANYILGWRRAALAASDRRMHSRGSIHSRPGRRRYEDPLTQNVPKEATIVFGGQRKTRPNLRQQVVAPRGRVLLYWDFATLHPRIIALFSGDPFLVKLFNEGRDIHVEFAREIWKEWDQLSDEERAECRDMVKPAEYCLAPGTRVLTAGLAWRPIEELKVGDKLVGFGEQTGFFKDTYFRPSRVRAVKTLKRPCYEVVTDRGTVVASAEHMWVGRKWNGYAPKAWLRTDELCPGHMLTFTMAPWVEDGSRDAGYLAGIFDGEGWLSAGKVGFAQKRGPTLQRVVSLLKERGYKFHSYDHSGSIDVVTLALAGVWESMRFLGSIRPPRLLPKAADIWTGQRRLRGTRKAAGARILSVTPIGWREVVAVQTSTRTFIAEGFLSHNCILYCGAVETAWQAIVKKRPYVKLQQVQTMVAAMQRSVSTLPQWHQTLFREVAKPPHVLRSAILGRMACFPMGEADPSDVTNLPVLMTEVDIVSTGMANFWQRKPRGVEMIIDTHDGGVIECDEKDAVKVARLVRECFSQTHTRNGVTVEFPVKVSIAKDWGSLDDKKNVWKGE